MYFYTSLFNNDDIKSSVILFKEKKDDSLILKRDEDNFI